MNVKKIRIRYEILSYDLKQFKENATFIHTFFELI